MHEASVICADIERVARRVAQDIQEPQLDLAELFVKTPFAPVENPLRADRLQRALDAAPPPLLQDRFAEFCRSKHAHAPWTRAADIRSGPARNAVVKK